MGIHCRVVESNQNCREKVVAAQADQRQGDWRILVIITRNEMMIYSYVKNV